MAVTRLKRYLPDPTRRLDLHDLVSEVVDSTAEAAASEPTHHQGLDGQTLDEVFSRLLAVAEPVLQLLSTGVLHDRDRQHTDLWVDSIQRLLRARERITGSFQETLDRARHYPALLAMRAAGIVALHAGRDDVLLRLLTEPTWRDRYDARSRRPAVHALHDYDVLGSDVVNAMPRWGGQRWLYPPSHMLRADLREVLRPALPDGDDYTWASDRYEYRVALLQEAESSLLGRSLAAPGEFMGDYQRQADGGPLAEADFQTLADQAAGDWTWWRVVGGREGIADSLARLRRTLEAMRRWG